MTTAAELIEFDAPTRRFLAKKIIERCGLNMDAPEFRAVIEAEHKEMITTGGVRAGKSTSAAAKLYVSIYMYAAILKAGGLYWIIGPDYWQARVEYGYIRAWAEAHHIFIESSQPVDGGWVLTLANGVTVETKSALHPERLGSVAPRAVLVVEAGQCTEDIRNICVERTMENAAPIYYSGTLEDDEQHATWAWYAELAEEWTNEPSEEHGSYGLPSWTNTSIYGSCLAAISQSPSLAAYCPDDDHGTAHSGELHPTIAQARFIMEPREFDRRIAGKPGSLAFKIYPSLETHNRLIPFEGGPQLYAYGGIDYGTEHASALAAVTYHPRIGVELGDTDYREDAWVREVAYNDVDPGDTKWIRDTKVYLERKWKIPGAYWRYDPNEKYMARREGGEAVSGTAGSRDYRMGLCKGRINSDTIFYDSEGPGVPRAYKEAISMRKYKRKDGKMILSRVLEDGQSAIEDAIEGSDGMLRVPPPAKLRVRRQFKRRRPSELKHV